MTNPKRATGPHCTIHTETALICPRCIAVKGGQSRSKKKLAAVRRNAKKARRVANQKLPDSPLL